MSTPIEIARDFIENRKAMGMGTDEQNAALASVLRAAERFQTMAERIKLVPVREGIAFVNCAWEIEAWTGHITLAELADKLRSETK